MYVRNIFGHLTDIPAAELRMCLTHEVEVFERLGFRHTSLDINGRDGAVVVDLSRRFLGLGLGGRVTRWRAYIDLLFIPN